MGKISKSFEQYKHEMYRLLNEQPTDRANCVGSVLYLLGLKDKLASLCPEDMKEFIGDWRQISEDELKEGDLIIRFLRPSGYIDHVGIVADVSSSMIFHKMNWLPYAMDSLAGFKRSHITDQGDVYVERCFRPN